jgi:hypothetical protein
MPFGMGGYVQSVVVQGRVYVGGGGAIPNSDYYIVMEYDTSSGEWTELPPYRVYLFAMTAINNQLVLVGGRKHDHYSKMLGVWRAESKEWTNPYPDMSTARSFCSVVAYKEEWLVVAGGWKDGRLSSVEVLNVDSKQWCAGFPTPTPWSHMRTVAVGDVCYFMGGVTGETYSTKVYNVSLPALISQLHSQDSRDRGKQHQIWKEISELQTTISTPLSISGSLLAVGGKDKEHHAVTAIHLYQPDTEEWVKVGDLQTPRWSCTCAMIGEKEMFVAGGQDRTHYLFKSDMALINTQ